MAERPPWIYDELRQVGLDFEDIAAVADYDRNQGSDRSAERALCARLGVAPGRTVIDLGCGTGSFALEAAHSGASVHAVDVSRAMLDYAAARARADGLEGIRFHHGGFLTYAHQGAPADLVVTRYALHRLPDFWKMAALLRLSEMLRPDGRLYLEDVVFSFEPAHYAAGAEAWIGRVAMPPGEGFTAQDFQTHLREGYSTYSWILEAMALRAGFVIEAAELPDPAYGTYLCAKAE